MSLLNAFSFEETNSLGQIGSLLMGPDVWTSSVPSISSAHPRTGSQCFFYDANADNPNGRYNAWYVPFGSSLTTAILGFAYDPDTIPSNDGPAPGGGGQIMSFTDGPAGSSQMTLCINSVGQLFVRSGNSGTILGTSTRALAAGVYRFIQVKATFHSSTGSVTVKVDGVTWLSLTGLNLGPSGNNYATGFALGHYQAISQNTGLHYKCYIDDVHLLDTNGSVNNDFIGDYACKTKMPNGNGTQNDYTRGGTDSGANWSQINETPPDDDTKYLVDSTVSHENRSTFASVTANTIAGVVQKIRARKDDGGTRSIRAVAKHSGTEVDNGSDIALASNYQTFPIPWETDPSGSPWTQTSVNATEFGSKITA